MSSETVLQRRKGMFGKIVFGIFMVYGLLLGHLLESMHELGLIAWIVGAHMTFFVGAVFIGRQKKS